MPFPFVQMTFSFQKCYAKMGMCEKRAHFNYFHPDLTKYVIVFTHPETEIVINGSLFMFFFTET